MNTLSVALCTFNGAAYISQQLESIVQQTVRPDEIVICDDGSTDETLSIIDQTLSRSGIRFNIYKNQERLGSRKNFAKCMSLCRGEIIFLCDQDDIWALTKVQLYINEFDRNDDVVMIYSDARLIDQSGKLIGESWWEICGFDGANFGKDKYCEKILSDWFISGFNVAIRKTLLRSIEPLPEFCYHDAWLALCAPCYGRVLTIPAKLADYRQHDKNLTAPIESTLQNLTQSSNATPTKREASVKKTGILEQFNRDLFDQARSLHYINSRFMQAHRTQLLLPANAEYHRLCRESVDFFGALASCSPTSPLSSVVKLVPHLINGNYARWRGGFRQFARDSLSIFVRRVYRSTATL